MIADREVPFSVSDGHYGRHDFVGIRELGFTSHGGFVVSAWTTPPGEPRGSYFTSLPISPVAYRREHSTATAFVRERGRLTIRDDWGRTHAIYAPADVLDALEAECIANEVPRAAPEGGPR